MVNRPILKPVGKYQFELVENYRYRDIVIPKGYITDGASVPRIFWSIFPPNKAEYLSAAIVHDYLTDIVIEKKSITFRSADNTFKEMLIDLNVNKIEVTVLYWSVRLYHLLRYGD
ncbi:DUF1353 domain-containing protein [Campylobacter concisus]|uniref:DUF1353 domain-containing protein n=1 Tax=Campylobacter concisus TaxID=199 RepID=A0A1Y5MKX8_9BACT|nr:DUF1353 domain-containing protein [Campylobacter concisus]OUT06889.1 hypothetical protein B9N65_09925 [Campylobacter concisus]OUT08947.1 hypothetical protein B9N65_01000 [Campylobacter concisus]